MLISYLLLKLLHIFIAIVALGTSAALGIVLEFYGDDPTHGSFLLRVIRRLVAFVVIPGYLLMLVTGLWMVNLSWPLETKWIQASLALWGSGLLLLVVFQVVLRKQLLLLESGGPASRASRGLSLLGRGLGAGVGLVAVAILYLMVFKP